MAEIETLRRLGSVPFWRGDEYVARDMEKLYSRAMARATAALAGEAVKSASVRDGEVAE